MSKRLKLRIVAGTACLVLGTVTCGAIATSAAATEIAPGVRVQSLRSALENVSTAAENAPTAVAPQKSMAQAEGPIWPNWHNWKNSRSRPGRP